MAQLSEGLQTKNIIKIRPLSLSKTLAPSHPGSNSEGMHTYLGLNLSLCSGVATTRHHHTGIMQVSALSSTEHEIQRNRTIHDCMQHEAMLISPSGQLLAPNNMHEIDVFSNHHLIPLWWSVVLFLAYRHYTPYLFEHPVRANRFNASSDHICLRHAKAS